jgi:hypothetical protein
MFERCWTGCDLNASIRGFSLRSKYGGLAHGLPSVGASRADDRDSQRGPARGAIATALSPICPPTATLSNWHPLRPVALEDRQRELQHPEGLQSRTQFRPQQAIPVRRPRHPQSAGLRLPHRRRTYLRALASSHHPGRHPKPLLRTSAINHGRPCSSLLAEPADNLGFRSPASAAAMTIPQNENGCFAPGGLDMCKPAMGRLTFSA